MNKEKILELLKSLIRFNVELDSCDSGCCAYIEKEFREDGDCVYWEDIEKVIKQLEESPE